MVIADETISIVFDQKFKSFTVKEVAQMVGMILAMKTYGNIKNKKA